MSILSTLDRKKFSNLVDIMDDYDSRLKGWKENMYIDGKNIQSATIEQATWLAYYDEIKVELKTLLDFFDMKVKEVRGKAMAMIMKYSQEIHNERSRERLIDSDPDYVKMQQIYLEVKELYALADSIVFQYIQRGYVITNLVKIRTADLQDITLFL